MCILLVVLMDKRREARGERREGKRGEVSQEGRGNERV